MLAEEHDRLRPRQHAHVARQPELERELPDEPIAERVERRDRRVRVAVRHELVDPGLHLVGGLVRERQREDLRRPRAAGGDQPRDPAGDDLRLARAGARDHEQRPVAVGDGLALLGVEAAEQRLEPRLARVRPRVRRARWRPRPGSGRAAAGSRPMRRLTRRSRLDVGVDGATGRGHEPTIGVRPCQLGCHAPRHDPRHVSRSAPDVAPMASASRSASLSSAERVVSDVPLAIAFP